MLWAINHMHASPRPSPHTSPARAYGATDPADTYGDGVGATFASCLPIWWSIGSPVAVGTCSVGTRSLLGHHLRPPRAFGPDTYRVEYAVSPYRLLCRRRARHSISQQEKDLAI